MTTLTLEGYRYSGQFKIAECKTPYSEEVTTEVGWYKRNGYHTHFTGESIIRDLKTGSEQRFLIYPNGMDESNIIILDSALKRGLDSKKVLDLALGEMYQQAKNSKELIPKVYPGSIDKLARAEIRDAFLEESLQAK